MSINNKGMKLALAALVATNVAAVASPADAASQTSTLQLVQKAEKQAALLQKEITYEQRAKLYPSNKFGLPNAKIYNNTNASLKAAKTAVNKLKSNATKKALLAKLTKVENVYKSATVYTNVVKTIQSINKENSTLLIAYNNGKIDDAIVKKHTNFVNKVSKLTKLFNQLQGTNTKKAFKAAYATKFEQTNQTLKVAISIEQDLKQIESLLAAKDFDNAKALQEALLQRLTDAKKAGYIKGSPFVRYTQTITKTKETIDNAIKGNQSQEKPVTPPVVNVGGGGGGGGADTQKPTITSISASNPDGVYVSSDTVTILVTFSENVTVTGTPQLTLETGSVDAVAAYIEGTGTKTLKFNYTVNADDFSSDLNVIALVGTIKDAAGNTATLTVPTSKVIGSLDKNKAIVVFGNASTITEPIVIDGAITSNSTFNLKGKTVTDLTVDLSGLASGQNITLTNGTITNFTLINKAGVNIDLNNVTITNTIIK